MRGKDLLFMLSEIDSDLIEQAESTEACAPKPKAAHNRIKYISIAACAVAAAAVLAFAFLRDAPAHGNINVSTDVSTPTTSQTVPDGAAAATSPSDADSTVTSPSDGDTTPGVGGVSDIHEPSPSPDDPNARDDPDSTAHDDETPVVEGPFEPAVPLLTPEDVPEYENKGVYDGKLVSQSDPLPADSLKELCCNLDSDIDSLYRIEISELIPAEESRKLAGYRPNEDSDSSFYRAAITYDYIDRETLDREVIICLPGTPENQVSGQPPYAKGDVIAALLLYKEDGSQITRPLSGYAFIYDIVTVYDYDFALARGVGYPEVAKELYGCSESFSRVTTAAENPAEYHGIYEAKTLGTILNRLVKCWTDIYGLDYVNTLPVQTVYEDTDLIIFNSATGGTFSYKELAEDMYSSGKAYGLVRLETIETYTPAEAAEITGNTAFTEYPGVRALVKARITYDYLNGRKLTQEIFIAPTVITSAAESIAIISEPNEYGYYLPEMLFDVYNVNGRDIAYQRGDKWIALANALYSELADSNYPDVGFSMSDFPNLDLAMAASEALVLKPSDPDSAVYTYKMTLEDLTGFMRADWAARGISFKGFDIPDTDNSENRHKLFKYHDVKLTEYRPSFSAEADFLGNYDFADISAELLKGKPGLRLIEFEVTDILPDEKAAEVSGRTDGTLYTLRVLNDFTAGSGEAAVESSNITLWHYGNGSEQYLGYPVWAEGERFIAAVYDSGKGYYLPVYELEFALMRSPIDHVVYAYDIAEGPVYFDSLGLTRGVPEIEYLWHSTTENNERRVGGRFEPDKLAEAIAGYVK